MVKVAVAGFGEVSREVIKAILAEGRHEVTVFSRKDAPHDVLPGLRWTKVDYENKQQLTKALEGIHTVLSFVIAHLDPGSIAQINLIDSCVEAGVKRFAPSEWVLADVDGVPVYENKVKVRRYLENINKPKKVLEYCLFFPGVFMNYLAPPDKVGADISYAQLFIDLANCRAIIPDGINSDVSLTTIQDLGKVVAGALDYDGEWPVMGGISASKKSISDLIQLGERIRGKPFSTETIKVKDLEADTFTTSWSPEIQHPSVPVKGREAVAREYLKMLVLNLAKGACDIPDVWNRLLPDIKLTTIEDFVQDAWGEMESNGDHHRA